MPWDAIADLQEALNRINNVAGDLQMQAAVIDDAAFAQAGVSVDTAQLNQVVEDVTRIAQEYGLRIPREFGLLVKQMLYFNRFMSQMAPELSLSDPRIDFGSSDSELL